MDRRNFLKFGGAAAGLLAATGKPFADALADFTAASATDAAEDFVAVTPASTAFSGLTQGFNRRWSAPNCSVVYVALSENGVQAALDTILAGGNAENFSVRGGGHCYEDFVFNSAIGAIIDLSLLSDVGYDRDRDVYYAQGGGTIWDFYRKLYWRFGKTLPGGSCYSVGLGGHIAGGGYGLLSRQFGLTVDWLSGVRIVVPKGPSLIRVTKDAADPDERNLFWANTGGGGGNFGIVTRYEFASLPTAPRYAELTFLSWDWKTIIRKGRAYLQGILDFFEELTRTGPNTMFGLLKLNHQSAGQITLILQNVYDDASLGAATMGPMLGSLLRSHGVAEVAATVGPILGHPVNLPAPAMQTQHLKWIEAVQTLNGSGPNQKGKQKSAYMRAGFTRAMVASIYKYLTARRFTPRGAPVDLSSSLLQVDTYGGAVNAVSPTATAVAQRSSIFKLQYQTYWQDPEDGPSDNGDGHLAWIRDFYSEMYANLGGIPDPAQDRSHNVDGCFINYPDVDLNDHGLRTALRLYYGINLPRLISAKQTWDPDNRFHHAQSIPLA